MRINVTVKPGSSQNKVAINGENDVTVWTHARAHDGEANRAVIEALSDFYKVPKTSIKLIRGETSKKKTFEL